MNTPHEQASRLYHGTRTPLSPGDLIEPPTSAAADDACAGYLFLTDKLDEAHWDAELAPGDGDAHIYVIEASGEVQAASAIPGRKTVGHPTMSLCSRDALRVIEEVTEWMLYHGTRADLKPGDVIKPGHRPNYGNRERTSNFVYFSRTLEAATWGAELAEGEGAGRIYIVEATGAIEDDPNVTNKRFRGNPTKSFRSRAALRVVGEVFDWKGHAPEALKAMKDHLARLKEQGVEPLDD